MTVAPRHPIAPTVTLEQAVGRLWDVLVVGAGPAGVLAAAESASRGASVLLVDRAIFPRWKVCGCCLNAAALATLETVGLGFLPARLGAQSLHRLWLLCGRREAVIPLPFGVALSREAFDTALIEHAVQAGVDFLPQTSAASDGVNGIARWMTLRCGQEQIRVQASVVLVADGLSGRALRDEQGFEMAAARSSRVGVGTFLEDAPDWCPAGTIVMACGQGGYVGLVRLEDGRLNVAAALDLALIRRAQGVGAAVTALLKEAGLWPIEGLRAQSWHGTPALTRRPARVAGERLFVLGDAAGYVEPFTGEGIAVALASGKAVAPLAIEASRQWSPALMSRWKRLHRGLFGSRQRTCRIVTGLLRRPRLTRAAVTVLSRAPHLVAPLITAINAPFPCVRPPACLVQGSSEWP